MAIDCAHRWHSAGWRGFAAPYRAYTIDHGSLVSTAYECIACGFRTLTVYDDDDNDVTDLAIVKSWRPSLVTRLREEWEDWQDARSIRRG